jgi:hypothetical protein
MVATLACSGLFAVTGACGPSAAAPSYPGDERSETPPAPTTSTSAVAPSSAPDPAHSLCNFERLRELSVMARFPELDIFAAENLAKVRSVVERAPRELFVHYRSNGAPAIAASERFGPDTATFQMLDDGSVRRWQPSGAVGLARYGGEAVPFVHIDRYGVGVAALAGYDPMLRDRTPGFVWHADRSSLLFVALDGARYSVYPSGEDCRATVEEGTPPGAAWPPPVADPLFGQRSLVSYVGDDLSESFGAAYHRQVATSTGAYRAASRRAAWTSWLPKERTRWAPPSDHAANRASTPSSRHSCAPSRTAPSGGGRSSRWRELALPASVPKTSSELVGASRTGEPVDGHDLCRRKAACCPSRLRGSTPGRGSAARGE